MYPIDRYFNVGVIAAMAYPAFSQNPVEVVKKIAADSYFNAIELNPVNDAEQCRQIKDILSQSGMATSYGAQGRLLSTGLNPNSLDEKERIKAQQTLIEGVDEAAALGAKRMAFLSGHWSLETREQSLDQLYKTTCAVCEYAAKQDILVQIEVFDFDIDKKSLLGPAPLAEQFAARVRSKHENFGLMIDLSHIPMCYESSRFTLEVLKPYITHFHIGNTVISNPESPAYGDQHPRFGYPEGENDVEQLLLFLKAAQREGFFCEHEPMFLSFEVKPMPNEDPEICLSNAKRTLNTAWALL